MEMKQELNRMNAAACLLVILIHVLSLGITSADPRSWQAAVLYFPWRLAAFVVPMFLYTGAVKMARQFPGREVTARGYVRYFLSRVRKIYVPYAIWVVIYYAVFLKIGYVRGSVREFFSYLVIGNLSSPFYYVVIVMQFYLLMPVWRWMLRRVPAYLAMGVSVLAAFCMQQSAYLLSLLGVDFPYSDRIFLTYMLYWTAGLYVGKYYEAAESAIRNSSGRLACGAVIVLCAGLGYAQYAAGVYLFNLNDVKMVSDLLSILLLHGVCLELDRAPAALRAGLDRIYDSSFFVYLSHCLFLTLATAYLQRLGVTRLSLLLPARFFTCYTVPFLLCRVYRRVAGRLGHGERLLG